MRKQFFYNNNQLQGKKIRKNLKQKWTKVVCIGTLSATVLTGIPVIPPTNAYAQEASVLSAKNVTYNLDDPKLFVEKTITSYGGTKHDVTIIEINITEDGTYTITGDNEINGAYIDVHITVADGVKANVILDNVTIKNDDLYDLDIRNCASSDERDQLFPFMEIMGTANLYLKGKNTVSMAKLHETQGCINTSMIFKLYGQLTISEDADTPNSSLQLNNAGYLMHGGGSQDNVGGSFIMKSGTVKAEGAKINNLAQWYMMGGSIICGQANLNDKGVYRFLDGDITSDYLGSTDTAKMGTARLFGSTYIGQLEDRNGYVLQKMTVSDLPVNQKVTAVNGYPASTLETSEEGKLEAYLRKGSNVIEINGESYLYKWDDGTSQLKKQTSPALCTVQFVLAGNKNAYCTVKVEKNTKFGKLFDDDQYTYTYQTEDGAQFNEDTVVSSDMKVTMTSSVREYNVTIDGVTKSMSTLPAGKIYLDPPDEWGAFGCCYYGGSRVIQDMTLESLDVVTEKGVDYVRISDKEELNRFSMMANADDRINAGLEADIDMEGAGLSADVENYIGIFNGNGHSIKNMQGGEITTGAICRTLKGTIRNLCLENVLLPGGNYKNEGSVGAVCGVNRGVIENCKVDGSSISIKRSSGGIYEYDPVGTVTGVNMGEIKNCLTVNNEFDTTQILDGASQDEIIFPIAANFGTVVNCYYDSDVDEEKQGSDIRAGIGRTKERMKSGEVCYHLNNEISDGTQVWYQNLFGEKADIYPTLKKNAANTVYDGYDMCKKVYTNTPNSKLTHSFDYTTDGDRIVATCQVNPAHQTNVMLTAENAQYDKKDHPAVEDYADTWGQYEGLKKCKITYLRDGKATTDLKSAGTITAVMKIEDAQVTKEYTIFKAAKPMQTPAQNLSVSFSQKTITKDMLKNDSDWEIKEEFIGKTIPETGGITVSAEYVGADKENYENTTVEIVVERLVCTHNLDKIEAVAATEKTEGNKKYYECKDCGKYFEDAQGTKEVTKESMVIPKLSPQPTTSPTASPTVAPTETSVPVTVPPVPGQTAISPSVKDEVLPVMMDLIQPVISKNVWQKLRWTKVKGADGYFIYASRCSEGEDIRNLKLVCTITSAGKTSFINKKLKEDTWYKYEIQAYRIVNGKKTAYGRSLQLHALTKGNRKYANPLKVRIAGKKKRMLKLGETSKLKAKVVLPTGKKCKWHIDKIRYVVSNPEVLSVSKKGKITTKKAGKATVYAVAQNGVMNKIKIKVTK